MHPNYYISPLAIALALGLASPVKAAEPMPLQKTSFNELKQKFQLALPGLKSAVIANDSLQFVRQHTDSNKVTHVRMQQQYAGFPVFGGYAIMHTQSTAHSLIGAKANAKMNGTVYKGLVSELGLPKAAFVKNGSQALEQFKAKYANQAVGEEQVTPMVYIDDKHQAHWAYKVSIFIRHDDKIPERPTAIIDAETNKPFVQWNDVKTALKPVKGSGFGGNTKIGEYQFGKDFPLLDMSRDESIETCYMENTDVKVVDMMHRFYSNNKPMKFSCAINPAADQTENYLTGYQADGYDKDNGASSPTNDALYAGYVIKHMYHDWYGIEVLTKSDGSPMQLVMRVHYGQGYENAYWDGKQMTFGDGDTMMYPLVSLGVGGHEISHGFTEQHSNLEYFGQSGGMNEAFSDMAAQAAEFYSAGKSSWQIGPEIMKEDSGYDALRFMDKPSRDGSSIDSADEYYGGIDVHYSSGVYNHLFYILSNQPAWNIRMAFDVMVKANMDYWSPYVNFEDGGCGIISATEDLKFSVDDVKKSLEEVAIDYSSCSAN